MFRSARIKLTLWYVFIAFIITAFFSVLAFNGFRLEFERGLERQQRIIIQREYNGPPPAGLDYRRIDPNVLSEIREWLILRILLIDGLIIVISAASGYFLAGRALKPIRIMVDEQNRFISDASHELRTPLTAMSTSLEVGLRDKKINLEKARQLLEENLTDVKELQTLTNNLLLLAYYNKEGNNSAVNLKDILQKAIDKVTPLAKNKRIQIIFTSNKYYIKGDEQKLIQLFVILLDNAIKYSSSGKKINIKAKKTDGKIEVSVKDEGIGIKTEDLPHIFDRFYRSEKSRTSSGFGLGLSIAKKITEEHGGNIKALSEPEKGTTFLINLPSRT